MEQTLSQALSDITSEVGVIEKKKQSTGVTYAFRGIDEVMNKLNPLLSKHGVTLQNEICSHNLERREVTTSSGYVKNAYVATVHIRLIFSKGTEKEVWEEVAMSEDYGDKAMTQAMSMAYKYAILRKFCILTKDVIDPDGRNPENDATPKQTPAASATPAPLPELLRTHDKWKSVTEALMKGTATLDQVKSKFVVSALVEKELLTIIEKAKEATK